MNMAIELERGMDVKNIEENGSVWATPVVLDRRIYFGSFDTYFYCFDLYTGQKICEQNQIFRKQYSFRHTSSKYREYFNISKFQFYFCNQTWS